MKLPGLPVELQELLARLQGRGIAVGPLEVGRLRHLLELEAGVGYQGLEPLLRALLCKDGRQRALFEREYRRWLREQERYLDRTAGAPGEPEAQDAAAPTLRQRAQPAGKGGAARERGGTRRPVRLAARLRALIAFARDHHTPLLVAVTLLLLLGLVLWLLYPAPGPRPSAPVTGPGARHPGPPATLPDELCPQELPSEPASQVWAWVPDPDYRPWIALGGGFLLLFAVAGGLWRLYGAEGRYLAGRGEAAGGDAAPRRGLPPLRLPGDLLLDPAGRRELVWSIGRYVSEEPAAELDLEATVAATAGAAGQPRLIPRHLSFPRQVWLWCDRRTACTALQDRLVAEVRRALEQANLPVRVARFHGLPTRLVWEEGGEPFTPACNEAAGAQAAVALISDGAALVRAWEGRGERPLAERLLRELRTWPRLCLVDLGEGAALRRLAREWRLSACAGDGLAAWLAGRGARARPPEGEGAAVASPDLRPDLELERWAAGWLLLAPPRDHDTAQALRQAMDLRLGAFDYPRLSALLEDCAEAPGLAERLVNRLARGQALDRRGRPRGSGPFTRALDFWERRLQAAIDVLDPEQDAESRARLEAARARLRLWRDPQAASAELVRLAGGRNRSLVAEMLHCLAPRRSPRREVETAQPARRGDGAPAAELRPTWDWRDLPQETRVRLLELGLQGLDRSRWRLRPGVRHHLALALLAGIALGGLGWGVWRFLAPHETDAPFAGRSVLIHARQGATVRLGSPWSLATLPAVGPFETPYVWSWQPQKNPWQLGEHAGIFTSGTQNFPIRACAEGWPRRVLAVVQAPLDGEDARRLAIRLLDRGSADRVLLAEDWPSHLEELDQGLRLSDDRLLVFLPPDADLPDPELEARLRARFADLALIRGAPAGLAAALDFHGVRPLQGVWPGEGTRILAGAPKVSGGPEGWDDPATGVTWLRVCGGTFAMGSPNSELGRVGDYARQWRGNWTEWLGSEMPRHAVVIDDFWMTRHEITRGQAASLAGSSGRAGLSDRLRERLAGLARPGGGEADLPLANIDWETSQDLCSVFASPPRMGADDRRMPPALPSEAQWEYAARAGTATRWSFGEDQDRIGDHAWYGDNSDGNVHPVGDKRPNGLCLADMHGNVWEWTADCWRADAYQARADRLPVDPRRTSGACDRRAVRGGSLEVPPVLLRSAFRVGVRPDVRDVGLGLRCVRSRVRQP